MKRLTLYSLLLGAIGVTAVSAVVHARLSNRWGRAEELLAVGQRLQAFPEKFGPWQETESYEMDETVTNLLQCVDYLNCQYTNQETGDVVAAAVLLGPPGPISVHTPEVCYSSREYSIVQAKTPLTIQDASGSTIELWATTFQSTRVDGSLLRVYYGWCTDGYWSATEHPRFSFVGQPFLFKIQLATHLTTESETEQQDVCQDFLRDFAPAFREHVFDHGE